MPHLYSLILLLLTLSPSSTATTHLLPPPTSTLPPDAVALLTFKSKADLHNTLPYTTTDRFDYCQWPGVKCVQNRVVRLALRGAALTGSFPPDTLSRLDQLRVLTLKNNSLSGPLPDLSPLLHLKSLLLDHNLFSGPFPPSILSLPRIQILDLSHNLLTGPIPADITLLDRLQYLRLDSNRFDGGVPALNQSSLTFLNVSNNNLTGPVPVTPTLARFGIPSFSSNPSLCGEIVHKECPSDRPFFNSSGGGGESPPLIQSQGGVSVVLSPPSPEKKHGRVGVVVGVVLGALILLAAVLCLFVLFKRFGGHERSSKSLAIEEKTDNSSAANEAELVDTATSVNSAKKEKKIDEVEFVHTAVSTNSAKQERKTDTAASEARKPATGRSGNLIFCSGEGTYDLEMLMRASAELLGRGTVGTTYKAVMNDGVVVTVKRLDAGKTAMARGEVFERHMEVVGGLKHPNLVPVRAYYQAKDERLVIYDYQPNGSLFNLIHGSRSTRAKPLHWTSCLKIAEDVSQGLAYIHQASKLIHGNLKSSNVLLGSDFEACLTDYSLSVLADSSSTGDPDSEGYKAPEIRKSSSRRATPKSDVYAFGVLLLELLTGKPPSQHPFLSPPDMWDWVVAMREEDSGDDNRLCMLVDVAGICSLTSPEQRPLMWQVLKMIREVKESVVVEDNARS